MRTLIIILLLFANSPIYAQSIFGKWKTIDDETNKPKSVVEIYEKDGRAYGKIIKLFQEPDEDPDPICDECSDYRKNEKVLGMQIITDMIKDQDDWEDGEILDPENGKVYRCKLWVKDGTLQVRGYIAFFFRTQTWLPYSNP
jgi:uncharacterized protein (DUF2147 family)